MADNQSPDEPDLLEEVWNTAFEPYAREIGYLLNEWTQLHEKLQELFVLLANFEDEKTGLAIWHAIPVDRLQREMIRAVINERYSLKPEDYDHPETKRHKNKVREELTWIMERADTIGRHRDDAAHIPVALMFSDPMQFVAFHMRGNRIAGRLRDKRLLDEFKLYRERARILRLHVVEWMIALAGKPWSWPEKPRWPNPPQKASPGEESSRTKRRKERSPRPRSSGR